MSPGVSVVAIISAYNEADIIEQVVVELIEQGIGVYLMDDGSTDATVRIVEQHRDRGVLGIERFDETPGEGRFSLERILRRKTELATTLDADWFINHDADEFRESPWAGVSLAEGIARVDARGFNAIDFAGFDFAPTEPAPDSNGDIRRSLPFCTPFAAYDRIQIRAWKKTASLDLVTTAGHEARFPGRRVFPLRFVLRHYPIRGQSHGERKVFAERRPRFSEVERARGWHVQYDGIDEEASFVRDAASLTRYDADAIRIDLALRHRGVEALEANLAERDAELALVRSDLESSRTEAAALTSLLAAETARLNEARSGLAVETALVAERGRQVEVLQASLAAVESARAVATAEFERRLDELYSVAQLAMDGAGARAVPDARRQVAVPQAAPKVSVVVTCYDLGAYVDEAVGSVFAQTFQDFEVILVDDGSTDPATCALLERYQRPRTEVVRTPHRGSAAARNTGVMRASGEYLCVLDADDRLAPTYLEKTVKVLDADPSIAFVSTWLRTFGKEEWDWTPARCDLPTLLWEDTVLTAALARRAAVLDAGGFDTRMPEPGDEDWELWLTLVERGARGTILPEILFEYRRRSNSQSEHCWHGPGHVPLARYRVRKHAASYQAHALDVLLHQDDETAAWLRKNDALERRLGSELEPAVTAQREELTRLRARLHDAKGSKDADAAQAATAARVLELERALQATAEEVRAFRASKSWRVTAPLRSAYNMWLRWRGIA